MVGCSGMRPPRRCIPPPPPSYVSPIPGGPRMKPRHRVLALSLTGLAAASLSCSNHIEGPKPTLASIDPTLACDQQLVTPIAAAGTGFSPLPTDTLASQTKLVLPQVALTMSLDLAGMDA